MSAGNRVPTDGGAPLRQSPFGALPESNTGSRIPDTGKRDPNSQSGISGETVRSPVSQIPNQKNRGRVDITRETAGRGGRTVTVVGGFVGIGLPEKEALAKKIQRACGAGGTVKDGRIEIQGDKREQVARILAEAGFRPVFAGG
jgi:translation initiation factor 1